MNPPPLPSKKLHALSERHLFQGTTLLFVVIAFCSTDLLGGMGILFVLLPFTLILQGLVSYFLKRFNVSTLTRKLTLAAIALSLGGFILWQTSIFGFQSKSLIKLTLGGKLPAGIHNFYARDNAFTDYSVKAYFECEPDSLRPILETPPFQRTDYPMALPDTLAKLHPPITPKELVTFRRTDLGHNGLCYIYADPEFRYAYIMYSVD